MFVKINAVRVLNLDKILDFCLHKISSKNKCYYSFKTLEDGEYFSHEFESVKELNASLQYFDTIQEALESFNSEVEVKNTTNFLHESTINPVEYKFSNFEFLDIKTFEGIELVKVDYINWKGVEKKDLLIIPKEFHHGFNRFHPSSEKQLFLKGYDYAEYNNSNTEAITLKSYLVTSMSNIRVIYKT